MSLTKMNTFVLLLFFITIGEITCCKTDKDCTTIANSICTDGNCACNTGSFPSFDKSACLPYITQYGGECTEDAQCEWLGENSMCNYICTCKEGYRWYQGKCSKYTGLGGDCVETMDCFDGYSLQSLSCSNGKCVCSDGYYQRGDYDCRKIASKINDICALDIDCHFENGVCSRGKCQSSKHIKNLLQNEIEETEEEEEIATYAFVEKKCTINDDCLDISNSECYDKTKTCICKKKYFFNKNGTACIPELGVEAQCKADSDCPSKPGKCENGVCYCRDYYFVDEGNRNCIKTMSQNNWNCTRKEWCYALGQYSYCNSNGSCTCSRLSDFDDKNLFCKLNDNNNATGMCSFDYECTKVQGAHCIDEECGCLFGYILLDNKCIPNHIGAPCSEEGICAINNSKCVSGICQCQTDYVAYEDTQCLEIKDHLGDVCEEDVQCDTTITYSECVNKKCACSEKYLAYNNTCYERKAYNSYCNNLFECRISLGETYQCRNRLCQCPTGYTLKEGVCSSGYISSGNLIVALAMVLKGILSVFC